MWGPDGFLSSGNSDAMSPVKPIVTSDGTTAWGAVDVVRVKLLVPDPISHLAEVREGHMEVQGTVPAGGITCNTAAPGTTASTTPGGSSTTTTTAAGGTTTTTAGTSPGGATTTTTTNTPGGGTTPSTTTTTRAANNNNATTTPTTAAPQVQAVTFSQTPAATPQSQTPNFTG